MPAGNNRMKIVDFLQQALFQEDLHAAGKVRPEWIVIGFTATRRPSEDFNQAIRKHAVAFDEIEIFHVQSEVSTLTIFIEFLKLNGVAGLSISGQAHELVFALVDFKSDISSERAVKKTKGMGKCNFLDELQLGPITLTIGHCCPFSYGIYRKCGALRKA